MLVNRSSVTIKRTLNFHRSLHSSCIRLSVVAAIDNVFVTSIRFYGLPLARWFSFKIPRRRTSHRQRNRPYNWAFE